MSRRWNSFLRCSSPAISRASSRRRWTVASDFAQRYTAAVDFAALDRARFILDRTHAFADPNEADAAGIRLILPTPEILADAAQH